MKQKPTNTFCREKMSFHRDALLDRKSIVLQEGKLNLSLDRSNRKSKIISTDYTLELGDSGTL